MVNLDTDMRTLLFDIELYKDNTLLSIDVTHELPANVIAITWRGLDITEQLSLTEVQHVIELLNLPSNLKLHN